MPAVRNSPLKESRPNPYDNPNADKPGDAADAAQAAGPSTNTTAVVNDALGETLAARTPQPPPKTFKYVEWRLLTAERLRKFVKLSEPKQSTNMASATMSFVNFDLKGFCEDIGTDPSRYDLTASRNSLTVLTPLMRNSFGISPYVDEKTGDKSYSITLSLYSNDPEHQKEIEEFEDWMRNTVKPFIIESIIADKAKWDKNWAGKSDDYLREMVADALKGPWREGRPKDTSKYPEGGNWSPTINVKLDTRRDNRDEPLVAVFDSATKETKSASMVQRGDQLQVVLFFNRVTKVGSSMYEKWSTHQVVHTEYVGGGGISEAELDANTLAFPL